MWLLLIVAAFWLVAGIWGVTEGKADMVVGSLVASVGVGAGVLFIFFRQQREHDNRSLNWLWDNRDAIRRDGMPRGQAWVKPDTELTSYEVTVSFLFITSSFRSRMYFPEESREAVTARILCTLASLFFGPWGLLGPIETFITLKHNIRGGQTMKVGDLIEE